MFSKDTGAPKYQHALTLRLHNARIELIYGETDDDHAVNWSMVPGVEDCKSLLDTWPQEDCKHPWELPTKLDKWHKLWYELDACGHLLILHEFFNAIEHRSSCCGKISSLFIHLILLNESLFECSGKSYPSTDSKCAQRIPKSHRRRYIFATCGPDEPVE